MSWLTKEAGGQAYLHGKLKDMVIDYTGVPEEKWPIELFDQLQVATEAMANVITALEGEAKEGAVFDNPTYQRNDDNQGVSGLFEDEHVLDHTPDQSTDPGPASTTPGAKTPVSPGIFEY